jgi:hypothetical protein
MVLVVRDSDVDNHDLRVHHAAAAAAAADDDDDDDDNDGDDDDDDDDSVDRSGVLWRGDRRVPQGGQV